MEGTSLPSSSSNTNLVPQPRSGFEEHESALLPLGEDFLTLPEGEMLPPDTGIPPALYNPRETSIALAFSRSTPVPQPVEREQMSSVRTHPSPQPTNPEGMQPEAPQDLALLPSAPNPPPQDISGPMEVIPEEQEIVSLINMLNKQFNMYVRAQEAQNTQAMRRLLAQATLTQEMMEDIVGNADSIHLTPRTSAPDGAEDGHAGSYKPSSSPTPRPPAPNGNSYARASSFATLSARTRLPGSYPPLQSTGADSSSLRPNSSNAATAIPSATAASRETPSSFYTARWDPSTATPSLPAPQRALPSSSTPLSPVGRSAR
ncbi:hypothetical protein PTTG_07984 [Puccinia triticina 1-1 BBBD Race 1]|uniref:Uncharacterized protein n=1 Tax=Puccinia triticina (isolate 1-1 / race 1 (BBBD)) TaxID=630390 RepID=A0A180G718_PUCT1|nr:hypothetical protein PTTG_07984 [Puccinia triticina 1-1 BBBD Race 1]